MENLNKQQIVLLTLLVSFVTSIATGIVTVSLMDQAPQGITQTINQVVERTIEKVVPSDNKTPGEVIKETVVVKEDERVADAISKNKEALVRMFAVSADGLETFLGLGLTIGRDGVIVGPNAVLVDGSGDYIVAVMASGERVKINKLVFNLISKTAFYKIQPDKDGKMPAKIVASGITTVPAKLGQSIVLVHGERRDVVLTGIVSSLIPRTFTSSVASSTNPSVTEDIKTTYNFIDTNMLTANIAEGSPLFNLSGELIGFKMIGEDLFIPSDLILSDYKNLEKKLSAQTATSTVKTTN